MAVSESSWIESLRRLAKARHTWLALVAAIGVCLHIVLRFAADSTPLQRQWPLWAVLIIGGIPLTIELLLKIFRRDFGSDILAGISIVTAVLLEEYLAGSLVVLMLSGGEALEAYAVRSASRTLEALAKRMPSTAHLRQNSDLIDVALNIVRLDDVVVVYPHEVCPVDGVVIDGHSAMDESYLTGEPYVVSKTPGSKVLSGAINSEGALSIRATSLPKDSRYEQIIQVMKASQQQKPRLRRLGDQLGAYYTPLAVGIAVVAWAASGEPIRFLAVLVVATPCPLLIAIPVAIIGAISLAAKRGIIIKDPAALENISKCRTAIFDKTGTLTYGRPQLTGIVVNDPFEPDQALTLAASLERYSKHPLSAAILSAASERKLSLHNASSISEPPGRGLRGDVAGYGVSITGRNGLAELDPKSVAGLPVQTGGLECVVVIDGKYAATLRFRDEPRREGKDFISHLRPKHSFRRILLVSGDRESEVRYLAGHVGITDIYASQTPEQKLALVQREVSEAGTLFVGDGINDAPALTAATVGIAIGRNSDVTREAAHAVVLDSRLRTIDEFLHIGSRMRRIAMQSAVGGMILSIGGMLLASVGLLPPVAGAIFQEVIDVAVVLNALRTSILPTRLTDF